MKHRHLLIKGLVCSCFIAFFEMPIMAQDDKATWSRWLEKTALGPDFKAPATREAWEKKRSEIRDQLWQLLGKLPPRPKVPSVQTLRSEDRGDYTLETFKFDNGAGASVPGYLLIPKRRAAKAPAILYCHWHGGQY